MVITPFLFCILLHLASTFSLQFPIVNTSYGSVRGYEYRTRSGFVGEIFKKIPYAAPPTGERRWEKAVPPDKWNYTLDGTFYGPACAQIPRTWEGYVTGFSEDCLTMNVYTSRRCRESNQSCPVVVYIHGGAALFGGVITFSDEFLEEHYAKQEVVLVTINYRVGVFGMMALGDENVLPANLGIHDILESLRFIQKEIHNFGGDKDRVTVMGHSTGASIVVALVFSPAVNRPCEPPLFSSAIGFSSEMNFELEEKQVNASHIVAAKLGCAGTAREIVDCLRLLSSDQILETALEVGGSNMFSSAHVGGITLTGELTPIHNMKDLRQNQMKRSKQSTTFPPTRLLLGSQLNEFRIDLEYDFDFRYRVNEVLGVLNNEECVQKYASDIKAGNFPTDYDIISQAIFMTVSLFASAQAMAGGEVYIYQYDYPLHASHRDDLSLIMGTHAHPMDENENWMSRVFTVYITNFIKGLPLAPDWTPLNTQLMNYYSVNKSFEDGVSPKMKYGYHQDLTDYYAEMIKFDENLTTINQKMNAPVQYKSLSLPSKVSFSFSDLIFYSTLLGLVLLMIVKVHQSCQSSRLNPNVRYV